MNKLRNFNDFFALVVILIEIVIEHIELPTIIQILTFIWLELHKLQYMTFILLELQKLLGHGEIVSTSVYGAAAVPLATSILLACFLMVSSCFCCSSFLSFSSTPLSFNLPYLMWQCIYLIQVWSSLWPFGSPCCSKFFKYIYGHIEWLRLLVIYPTFGHRGKHHVDPLAENYRLVFIM